MPRCLVVLILAAALPAASQNRLVADPARVEALLFQDANGFREGNRRKPLEPNARLDAAAQKFADYMARTGEYGHRADGRTPGERVRAEGFAWCKVAENIAYAFDSRGFQSADLARKFLEGWKASAGHRQNLLDPDVTLTAVAVARDSRNYYFAVQLFARPCDR